PASRERPGDADEAFAMVAPLARAAAAVESVLFAAGAQAPADPQPRQEEIDLVAAWLLQSRLTHDTDAHVPLALLAATGTGDPGRAWAAGLRRRWPATASVHRPRRIWSVLARRRLEAADPLQPLSGWN